eukprot:12936500-Prorocentrum_lima.AAC.1
MEGVVIRFPTGRRVALVLFSKAMAQLLLPPKRKPHSSLVWYCRRPLPRPPTRPRVDSSICVPT